MGFNTSDRDKAKDILKDKGYTEKSDGRYINDSGKIGVFSSTGGSVKVDGHIYNSTSDLNKRKG